MPATKDEIAMKFFGLAAVHGYTRSTVKDVAKALRISKKTIYEHFTSKEEMLGYALDLVAERDRLRLLSMLGGATYLERILHLVRIVMEEARDFWEASQGTELMVYGRELGERAYAQALGRLLDDLVRGGVDAGEFEVEDPKMTAEFVLAIMQSATRKIQCETPAAPEEAAIEAVRRMLH